MASRRRRRSSAIESLEPRVHLSVARPSYNTGTGFFVTNGQVYDANGEAFVIRGLNQNHWWGTPSENTAAIDHVAKTGSNAVRAVFNKDLPGIVTSSGSDTPAERRAIVERILANNMVPIVEDHAVTNETYVNDPNGLHQVVTNWLDPANVSWLQQYEQKVILNIANEWGPSSTSTNKVWRDSYITQVQRLRAANVNALIMIDAGGWGQDPNTIRNDAAAVLAADPQHNIVFSSHFYSNWRTEDRAFDVTANGPYDVASYLTQIRNAGLPIVVGEFSWESLDFAPYRTRRVLEICEQLDIGYMGWGWNHNSPTGLNMLVDVPGGSVDWQYNSNADLTGWGDLIVNDPEVGIKATAKRATVFTTAEAPRLILEKTSVLVPETGHGLARVRLSHAPTTDVTVNLTKLAGGDADLALAGATGLTFTPANWNQYQAILLSSAADGDSAAGTARFQLAAAGMLSTDVIAKELDSGIATGSFTLTPTQDRDTQSDNAAGTNPTVSVSFWNHVYTKFDLTGVGGKAANAVLRVYRNQWESNLTYRVWLALDDNWTQSTAPASLPGRSSLALSQVVPSGVGYVDFNVTDLVNGQLLTDRTATIVLSTSSNNWMGVNTKENASNRPQLVITSTEAVPPQVVSGGFSVQSNPNRLSYTFTENVAASLGTSDVTVESLSSPGTFLTLAAPSYNAGTQTAAFDLVPGVVPDGRYRATLNASGVADAAANAMVLGHTLDFFALGADASGDQTVNDADYAIWQANVGAPSPTLATGDFNYDGVVNTLDRDVLFAQFGKTLLATPGAIAGRVFDDANGNGAQDSGEPGIGSRAVYLDVNGNAAHDLGEPSRTTDGAGGYSFAALGPGNYVVRQVVPPNWQQTSPAAGHNVALAAGQSVANADFGTSGVIPISVSALFVAGSAWNSAYRNSLATGGTGEAAFGYRVLPAEQGVTLPWSNLNQVSLRFSADIAVASGDLVVSGVNVASYGIGAFAYDPATFTATWTLDRTIPNDKLTLNLTSAALTYSSTLRVLPGDIDRNNVVNIFDFNTLKPNLNQTGLGVAAGDINGDNVVNIFDFNDFKTYLGKTTPA